MASIGPKLKSLRLRAQPTLTIRKIAEELGIGYSRYAYFEDEKRYKKGALPLDLTRAIADVLARHGVDPAEVMKLAGLQEAEAAPEARMIEAAQPPVQFISLPVMLPSEAALTDMFELLLALVPDDAPRAEVARTLAQRLPSGLAGIGPVPPASGTAPVPGGATTPQSPATDHPAPEPPSRS